MHAPEASTSSTARSEETANAEAAIFKRLHPATYLRRFVGEGVRPPDGRSFESFRDASINTGSVSTADGSSLVRIGQTSVVCGLRIEVAEPDVLRPKHGFLVSNLELSALCSSRFRPGPPSDEAQTMNDRLRKLIQAADLVPLRSLCIEPGKAVFVLYLDLVCISYDGNVVDAALLAANAALRNARLPGARWDEDQQVAYADDSIAASPLQLRPPILSSSYGIFEGETLLADPDAFEESLCGGHVIIALDASGNIRHVWQAGNIKDGVKTLQSCLALSRQQLKVMLDMLDR